MLIYILFGDYEVKYSLSYIYWPFMLLILLMVYSLFLPIYSMPKAIKKSQRKSCIIFNFTKFNKISIKIMKQMIDWGVYLNKYNILILGILMLNFHCPVRFCEVVSFLAEKRFKSTGWLMSRMLPSGFLNYDSYIKLWNCSCNGPSSNTSLLCEDSCVKL